jgi:hypothetical protein
MFVEKPAHTVGRLFLYSLFSPQGMLGTVRFEITKKDLSPVQRLVAAAGCIGK